jgi:hypothetical protein
MSERRTLPRRAFVRLRTSKRAKVAYLSYEVSNTSMQAAYAGNPDGPCIMRLGTPVMTSLGLPASCWKRGIAKRGANSNAMLTAPSTARQPLMSAVSPSPRPWPD